MILFHYALTYKLKLEKRVLEIVHYSKFIHEYNTYLKMAIPRKHKQPNLILPFHLK